MQMTNNEILANFRQAKDKKEQLKILADLNCCTQEEIRQKLLEAGCDEKEIPTKAKPKPKETYVPPKVEVKKTEGRNLSKSGDIILEALQLMRNDIVSRMARAEEEFAAYIKDQMQRLERIDEIVGGIA